jgi:hypothetical protein
MNKTLLYEIIGIFFIIIFGSLLHFTYESSGRNIVVASFSAVNESVWEHLKLAFFPALVYALFEYSRFKNNNFFYAKSVGIYIMPISIVLIFYTYTAFMRDNFVMDILSFIFAAVIGQVVSLKLLGSKKDMKLERVSLAAIVILGIAFVLFTYLPPHIFLFQDPRNGMYGI